MIVKTADDKQSQISIIENLLTHPHSNASIKKRIEQEIRNIKAGIRGEDEAAYEMKVHFGESKNWMIIHDLRIEHEDLVAQIDHLLINRWLDAWVCESKHFSEGIAINEHGEFSAFFGNKPYGVPSPIVQNEKHILILKRIFDSGVLHLPKRLGFTIKPNLKSLVLVSKKARISRPKAKVDGLDCIIKNDFLFKTIDTDIDNNNSPMVMAKIVSQETLENFAREVVNLHSPFTPNWAKKFGLDTPIQEKQTNQKNTNNPISKEEVEKPNKKLICFTCGEPIAYNVAKFCWFNKAKFGGNIFCMDCQKKI